MLTVGLKLTHDGGVAAIRDGELLFSTEIEKLDNRLRYSTLTTSDLITRILGDNGIRVDDVDRFVVDGWDGAPTSSAVLDGKQVTLNGYAESAAGEMLLGRALPGTLSIEGREVSFTSYPHIAGHVYSALATLPAAADESCVVLVWDGGLFPRLYAAQSDGSVRALGPVGHLIGHCYAIAAHHFGPYRRVVQSTSSDDLSVAGKLMAYIALGKHNDAVYRDLAELADQHFDGGGAQATAYRAAIKGIGSTGEPSHRYFHAFFDDLRDRVDARADCTDEDVLATVHDFLEDYLTTRVIAALASELGAGPWHLSFVGGCALNIKWNSRLRAQPEIASMWVPPFPNDSGSALGNAAIGAFLDGGTRRVSWNVRRGPELAALPDFAMEFLAAQGWTRRPCTIAALARLIHDTGQPVVFLQGRAELGPRALGGRSIIAAATSGTMKQLLNDMKEREHYRPVAPICLEEFAPGIFIPGTPDPYMLFDHDVRAEWQERIPAIVHLDGTARLQTVPRDADPTIRAILEAYYAISGIPVLCNTSANRKGSGFFPDVFSALEWGKVRYVWSDGVLYEQATDDQ
ncbi:MAG TPA: carbamoyltransferase N-terminal domain-containing protein [Trebonia sp.]|jgi:carbamoyltransferase